MINARRPGRVRYIQYNRHYIEYNFSVWQQQRVQVISAAAAGPRAGARVRVSARVLVRVLVMSVRVLVMSAGVLVRVLVKSK